MRRRYAVGMRRILVVLGALLIAVGLAWPWLSRLPLGRLPGDIVIVRPGFRFYFPLTTLILVSLIVSLLLRIFRR
ncbi:MAG TPA: DUF2905 domain-containing protein [Steroidobacteraceae bacterium]|nr:DUF2905 domain-containing protein [Steroidobacteraceae bacterium]